MKSARLTDLSAPSGLVGGPFGSSLVSADYQESGVPVIRGENLNAGKWIDGPFVYVSESKVSADLARNTARAGDVVFTQRGTLGQVALVPDGLADLFVVSQSQMRLRADRAKALPEFVYYAALAPAFLKQLTGRAITTGVPHINLGILASLEIPLPPLPTQRAIAEVLGALDDKIAANTRVAALSEDVLSTEFAALQGSPEGQVVAASDLVEFNPRSAMPTKPEPVYVDMQKLPTSGSQISAWSARPARGGARFVNGDTLMARITPCLENRKVGFVDFLDAGESALGSTEFVVMRSRPGFARPLSFLLAIDEGFRAHAIQHMVGSSGRQRVSAGDLASYELCLPLQSEELEALGVRSEAMFALLATLRDESRHLAELRDTLLPHLMSGRLTVREAEKHVEEVL